LPIFSGLKIFVDLQRYHALKRRGRTDAIAIIIANASTIAHSTRPSCTPCELLHLQYVYFQALTLKARTDAFVPPSSFWRCWFCWRSSCGRQNSFHAVLGPTFPSLVFLWPKIMQRFINKPSFRPQEVVPLAISSLTFALFVSSRLF
jgi:hypothetical protein